MRAPDLDRARDVAALHLALVQDPNPPTKTEDSAALAQAGDDDQVAALISADPSESSLLPAAELLATVASAWVASKFGPQWLATPERATRIGRALVRLAQKYLPAAESFGPEAELAIALGDWTLAGAAPMLEHQAADTRSATERAT